MRIGFKTFKKHDNKSLSFCKQCGSSLDHRHIEGKLRQTCTSKNCNYIEWSNPIPIVGGIIEVADGIVLAHNKSWPCEVYSIITGFLESAETPLEAIVREIKEELGLETKDSPESIGIYSNFTNNQLLLTYHVECEGNIVLGEELDSYKIVTKDAFRKWPFEQGILIGESSTSILAKKDWLGSFSFNIK